MLVDSKIYLYTYLQPVFTFLTFDKKWGWFSTLSHWQACLVSIISLIFRFSLAVLKNMEISNVIRTRHWKDRKYNVRRKKRTNNDKKNYTENLNWVTQTPLRPGENSGTPESCLKSGNNSWKMKALLILYVLTTPTRGQ